MLGLVGAGKDTDKADLEDLRFLDSFFTAQDRVTEVCLAPYRTRAWSPGALPQYCSFVSIQMYSISLMIHSDLSDL